MEKIEIFVGTTWVGVRSDKFGTVGKHISLVPFIHNYLIERVWVPRLNRYVTTHNFSRYDSDTEMALFPIGALGKLRDMLSQLAVVEETPVSPTKESFAHIGLKPDIAPRPHQVEILEFLTSGKSFLPVSVFTGGGKTVMAIMAVSHFSTPTIIVLGSLIPQWYKSLKNITTLKKREIFIAQGFNQLKKLWKKISTGYRPKVLIISLRTMILYGKRLNNYATLPTYAELEKTLGIGCCIKDEVHQNFHANIMVDLMINVRYSVYLSATYLRNDPCEKRIFNMCFPENLRFGGHLVKKHCSVVMAGYWISVPEHVQNRFHTARGYNHFKYESFLMSKKEIFSEFIEKVINPIIRQYYLSRRADKQKMLILCGSKEFAIALHDKIFTDGVSKAVYFSGDTSEYGEEKNLNKNIIITTMKSGGTGRDIPGLITTLNTFSFKSEPLAIQAMGRLRDIPGVKTVYVDIFNRTLARHNQHAAARLHAYQSRAAELVSTTI